MMGTRSRWVPPGFGVSILLLALAVSTLGSPGFAGMHAALTIRPEGGTWQVEVSANCNDRLVCQGETFLGQPFTVGGLWGWMELDPNGTGRAEFTACGHATSPGPAPGDTIHVSVRLTGWTVSKSGTFIILAGSETVRGGAMQGAVLPIEGPVDTGIRAAPGHYTALVGSGFSAASGVHVEIEVVETAAV